MENVIRKPYEISLWNDDLIFKVGYYDKNSGELVTTKEYIGSLDNFEEIEGTLTKVTQYYKERKICIIGSNTMDTPVRAVSSKLVSNVNGQNTLTFNIYSRYYDEEDGQFYENPFLKLLVNERKIKLRYGDLSSDDCKWYDFIIKDVKENSETKTFSYTCKDLFINELSKTGFNIQLDPELENNMGNIVDLATTVLEESDWQVGNNNDVLSQLKEEPLYKVRLNNSITAKDMKTQDLITISSGKEIYVFYSIITNEEPYFQFLYRADGNYSVDDNYVITNSPNYYIEEVSYNNQLPSFADSKEIERNYRGDRLVRQPLTQFDASIDEYVNIYHKKVGNDVEKINGTPVQYYGLVQSEYITPTSVQTFITNGEGFSSLNGWKVGAGWDENDDATRYYPSLDLEGYPKLTTDNIATIKDYRSFLKFKRTRDDQKLYNSGFSSHISAIKQLAEGDKYVFRAKLSKFSNDIPVPLNKSVNFVIAEYTLEKEKYVINNDKIYFSGTLPAIAVEKSWSQCIIESKVAKSYTDLLSARVGIFFETPLNTEVLFEQVQFFKYLTYNKPIRDEEGNVTGYQPNTMVEPDSELFSEVRTKYFYYLPDESYKTIDDIIPVYEGYVDNPAFIKVYNDNQFEKVRSVTATESNRFNIIQDLCEIFECWAKFEIEHNKQTGEVLLDENYRPKKWVTFHEYIGKDNFAGFRYGINLKSIQRTLNSDGIVSKIVVKDNANEFGKHGFCSIARASENPSGENFIYNFDYYIQQGLIGREEVYNDLYSNYSGGLNYYGQLKEINGTAQEMIDRQARLLEDMMEYEANYQTYKTSVETSEEELRDTGVKIKNTTGFTLAELLNLVDSAQNTEEAARTDDEKKALSWYQDSAVVALINKMAYLQSVINRHKELRDQEQTHDEITGLPNGGRLFEANKEYEEISDYLDTVTTEKRAINLQFYKKYSRFIQEGSWISEDYVDDNLYYLDAENTLFNSSQPKVTYTINVLELSQLEGYENYQFALGDKTYIEDTEFFGWVWKDGIKTPYHEEIVVSEMTVELDSPEKSSFKVQNFKTQFEDLFQRITATTQSVEFHTGEYDRSTNIVSSNGVISFDILQNSMTNNAIRLENARDQSVVWDETGITTTCLSNPSQVLRIVSGGIFISDDGGLNWTTGITANGINANCLTTGQINTSVINIMSGTTASFRWDSKGINAYQFNTDETGTPTGSYNPFKFVRFDQYGIYGINGNNSFDPNTTDAKGLRGEAKIREEASFALTWSGFSLKHKYGSGYTLIDSQKDIIIGQKTENSDIERIKIGRLDEIESGNYGIRIKNNENEVVLETSESGDLYIKGTIHAEAGNIGNVPVEDVEDAVNNMGSLAEATRKLDISSNLGYNFKVEGKTITPSSIPLKATPVVVQIDESTVVWEGSDDFESWTKLATGTFQYNLSYSAFKAGQLNQTYYVRVSGIGEDKKEYQDWVTIMAISDGQNGDDPISLVIISSGGGYFRNGNGTTNLTAKLFRAGVEIDVNGTEYEYEWTHTDSTNKQYGKTLQNVSAREINFSRTYTCNIKKIQVQS